MPTVMVDWPDAILDILCQSQLYVLATQFIEMRQWKPTSSDGIQLLFNTLLHTNMPQALLVQVTTINNTLQHRIYLLNNYTIQ
jgi:hypothetical protein